MPLISVLMSNYNTNEDYLREAINSILAQTVQDFEFIMIDDASTDDSVTVLESYLSDKRFKLLKNDKNMGLAYSLNKGLKVSNGKYIARADSDDIYLPRRFEEQVNWMDTHPDFIVCGTWTERFGSGSGMYTKIINSQEEYRIRLLFGNNPAIPHTSAIFSHELLNQNNLSYDEKYLCAQDYRMWVDCSKVSKLSILQEVLSRVRINPRGISVARVSEQNKFSRMIMEDQLKDLHLSMDDSIYNIHNNMLSRYDSVDDELREWMRAIILANDCYRVYDSHILKQTLTSNWKKRIRNSIKNNHNIISTLQNLKRINL